MRTLIMTGLVLASMGAAARDMFVVVHTRDAEVDVYRCGCRTDDVGCEPITRSVRRHPGSMSWHVVGGVAPYTVISTGRECAGAMVGITVMDAVGNISTGHGMIGTQFRYFNVSCAGGGNTLDATTLATPVQKTPKEPARVRIAPSGPFREPSPVDRNRARETVQPTRSTGATTFERRPSREQPAPAPSPRPVRSAAVSR